MTEWVSRACSPIVLPLGLTFSVVASLLSLSMPASGLTSCYLHLLPSGPGDPHGLILGFPAPLHHGQL